MIVTMVLDRFRRLFKQSFQDKLVLDGYRGDVQAMDHFS